VFVACSTLCFSREPLESALRHIAELEFNKIDLAVMEDGAQLRPSEVAENLDAAVKRLRQGPSLTVSALEVDFGPVDEKTLKRRFEAICRFAKVLTVAVISIPAAPRGTSLEAEIERLKGLAETANQEGLVLTVPTDGQTLTADPATALALCQAVPWLGLTLDPSHYINGPCAGSYDELFPHVINVRLRDTGRGPADFQVRVGQGEIEYGRIVNLLAREHYDRGLTVAILDRFDNPFEVEFEVRKLKRLLESLL
jgi:sugar phosphate isomerase/epimerase